jgi:hypothetical protein
MADESRNPRDQLRVNEFTRALEQNAEGQEATNRLVNELTGETKKEATRAEIRARRAERHAAKLERMQAAGGTAPAPITSAEAGVSERSAKAAKLRADSAKEEARLLPILLAGDRTRARGAGFTIRSAAEAIRLSGERTKEAIREAEAAQRTARAQAGYSERLPPPTPRAGSLLRPTIGATQQAATQATEQQTQATNRQREATAGLAGDKEALARAEANATAGTQRSRTEMERSSVAAGQASRDFRKRGALPTEFLTALAKGTTTFRELGWQMTTTIGKFAGWTAAATAVYGVLSAIQALHRGAIDSASGVALLSRVTTTELPGGSG